MGWTRHDLQIAAPRSHEWYRAADRAWSRSESMLDGGGEKRCPAKRGDVLELLRRYSELSSERIRGLLGLTKTQVQRILWDMAREGLIVGRWVEQMHWDPSWRNNPRGRHKVWRLAPTKRRRRR